MREWFYGTAGKRHGPVREADLADQLLNGWLPPDTLVWYEGLASWEPAERHFKVAVPPPLPDVNGPLPRSKQERPSLPLELAPASSPSDGFFARHWRGELSFPISIILALCLPLLLVYVALLAGFALLPESVTYVKINLLIVGVPVLALLTWQLVGLWRNTRRYSTAVMRWTSRVLVVTVLALPPALAVMNWNSFISQLVAPFEDYSVVVEHQSRAVRMTGAIGRSMPDRVRETLDLYPKYTHIVIDSSGGLIDAAYEIADMLMVRDIRVTVDKTCASACVVILMSGHERIAPEEAVIGFHRPSGLTAWLDAESDATPSQILDSDDGVYLRARGLPAAFVHKALAQKGEGMFFPSLDEMLSAGVLTHVIMDKEVVPAPNVPDKRVELLANQYWRPQGVDAFVRYVKDADPATYLELRERVLVLWNADEQNEGATQALAEVMAKVRRIVNAAAIAHGTDSEWSEYLDIMNAQLDHLRKGDERVCGMFVLGKAESDVLLKHASMSLLKRQNELLAGMAARKETRRPVSEDEIQQVAAIVVRHADAAGKRVKQVEIEEVLKDPELICDVTVATYAELANLPPGQRSSLLKALLSD